MYNNGKQFETSFSYMGRPKYIDFWLFGGLVLVGFSPILYICACQISKQSDKKLWGILGGPYVTPR